MRYIPSYNNFRKKLIKMTVQSKCVKHVKQTVSLRIIQPLQMLILHNSFKYKLIYNNGNKQTTSQQLLTLYWPNFLGWLLGLLVPYHWIQIRLKIAVTYIGENWFYWIFVFHEPRRLALSVSKKNKLKGACLKSYCTVQYC